MASFIQFIKNLKASRSHGGSWLDIMLFKKWNQSLKSGVNSMNARLPWLTIRAVDFLNQEVRRDFHVFEYGGGGSTLFWNSRVKFLATVEHDFGWFEALKGQIEKERKCEWLGLFIQPGEGDLVSSPDASEPDHYSSKDVNSKGLNYKAYVQSIMQFEDESFDVILIDGRCRSSCIRDSFPKLRIGGVMVLDNADRMYYSERNQMIFNRCRLELKGMGPAYFISHFSETRIYRRIA
jgi:hypothetical protein